MDSPLPKTTQNVIEIKSLKLTNIEIDQHRRLQQPPYRGVKNAQVALQRPGAKTIKKNTNSTQNKSETHHAKQYEVTSFLSTDCELSTETCSKNVYGLRTYRADYSITQVAKTLLKR